jgi:hypothetical protein
MFNGILFHKFERSRSMSGIKKMVAKLCDNCPLCSYARNNPESTFGKIMIWHGKFCPAWKAWEDEYGKKSNPNETQTVVK